MAVFSFSGAEMFIKEHCLFLTSMQDNGIFHGITVLYSIMGAQTINVLARPKLDKWKDQCAAQSDVLAA